MRSLKGLLIRKIVITGIFWCVPLLLFPSSLFQALGVPVTEPLLFIRLLGAAYLALLVGYYIGMSVIKEGESPAPVIQVGIASNGLVGLLLTYYGVAGAWSHWGVGAQVFIWLSMSGAFFITLNLIRLGLRYGVFGSAKV